MRTTFVTSYLLCKLFQNEIDSESLGAKKKADDEITFAKLKKKRVAQAISYLEFKD